MAGYLGNPRMVMMAQESMPVANYEYPGNPLTTTNPTRINVMWLNTITGELFVCIDNTPNANVWISQVNRPPISVEMTMANTQSGIATSQWVAAQFNNTIFQDVTGLSEPASYGIRVPTWARRANASVTLECGATSFQLDATAIFLDSAMKAQDKKLLTASYHSMSINSGVFAVVGGELITAKLWCITTGTIAAGIGNTLRASFWR